MSMWVLIWSGNEPLAIAAAKGFRGCACIVRSNKASSDSSLHLGLAAMIMGFYCF